MRITITNMEQVKETLEEINEFSSDMTEAIDSWLEAQEDTEIDADDIRGYRETIEENLDSLVDAARTILTTDSKNALVVSSQELKALVTKLTARVEELEEANADLRSRLEGPAEDD